MQTVEKNFSGKLNFKSNKQQRKIKEKIFVSSSFEDGGDWEKCALIRLNIFVISHQGIRLQIEGEVVGLGHFQNLKLNKYPTFKSLDNLQWHTTFIKPKQKVLSQTYQPIDGWTSLCSLKNVKNSNGKLKVE